MKEKLIIRNFGPIKNVELDLGRFNILIGEQATGKSTVAKVLAVCRYFSYVVWDGEVFGNDQSSFSNGLESWGLNEAIQENSYIYYENEDYSVHVQYGPYTKNDWFVDQDGNGEIAKVQIPVFAPSINYKSDKFKNLILELEKIKNFQSQNEQGIIARSIPTSFYLKDVKIVMDNPFYFPTQRGLQSIFSLGQSSIQNLSDALFNQLSKMDGIARRFTNETYIEPLNIFYKNVQGRGYIRKADETQYYSLFNAASGYQSEIPIVLVIKYYNDLQKRNKTFLIEEPEQNLFPSAQEKLMEYLVHQTISFGNSILLTTQSPYILTSLNNMMYAYMVGKIDSEKTSNIIDKRYWVNPEEVSAYMMKTDGTAENIIDEEVKQIKAERIDEISTIFNNDYDAMLDIKYSNRHEG